MNYEISHIKMFSRAMDFYGLKEVPGVENNPQIMGFFEEIGHGWVQGDEVSWCSCFINYLAKVSGYEYSGELTARSWLKVGRSVKRTPNVGDIVVFWRESVQSWKGHVGLFIRDDGENIWALGGNQSNAVNIKPYPKERLLDYRMLNVR